MTWILQKVRASSHFLYWTSCNGWVGIQTGLSGTGLKSERLKRVRQESDKSEPRTGNLADTTTSPTTCLRRKEGWIALQNSPTVKQEAENTERSAAFVCLLLVMYTSLRKLPHLANPSVPQQIIACVPLFAFPVTHTHLVLLSLWTPQKHPKPLPSFMMARMCFGGLGLKTISLFLNSTFAPHLLLPSLSLVLMR